MDYSKNIVKSPGPISKFLNHTCSHSTFQSSTIKFNMCKFKLILFPTISFTLDFHISDGLSLSLSLLSCFLQVVSLYILQVIPQQSLSSLTLAQWSLLLLFPFQYLITSCPEYSRNGLVVMLPSYTFFTLCYMILPGESVQVSNWAMSGCSVPVCPPSTGRYSPSALGIHALPVGGPDVIKDTGT